MVLTKLVATFRNGSAGFAGDEGSQMRMILEEILSEQNYVVPYMSEDSEDVKWCVMSHGSSRCVSDGDGGSRFIFIPFSQGRAFILFDGDVQKFKSHLLGSDYQDKNGENTPYNSYYIKNLDIAVDLALQLASKVDYEALEVLWQPDFSYDKQQEDLICEEFMSAAKTLVPAKLLRTFH